MSARAPAYAALLALLPVAGAAFPDGTPWSFAENQECVSCHFGAPVAENSKALSLAGLKAPPVPGRAYELTVRLADAGMAKAGFRLIARATLGDAGSFRGITPGLSAEGAKIRATRDAMALAKPGLAEWTLLWTAPRPIAGRIEMFLDANAANGDDSPLGDVIHRKRITVSP